MPGKPQALFGDGPAAANNVRAGRRGFCRYGTGGLGLHVREITITCDYCRERATVAAAARGRLPLVCSADCRTQARQLQSQAERLTPGLLC